MNNFYFFCASWTFFIAIFLRIKIYLSARKNHLQSLCNLPLRGWDIWGTFRELDGNIGGKKNPLPPPATPSPLQKEKKGPVSLAA
jgi:hypothetical protein